MKYMNRILTVLFLAGLMIFGQALTASEVKASEDEAYFHRTEPQMLNEAQVNELQQLLRQHGYEVGSTSGVLDRNTVAAIRQFQDMEGLTITGHPNRETLRALAPSNEQQEFFGLSPEYGEW